MSDNEYKELPFDFTKIDTTPVRPDKCSDERLLEWIKRINIIGANHGGHGLIAELAKRYSESLNADD